MLSDDSSGSAGRVGEAADARQRQGTHGGWVHAAPGETEEYVRDFLAGSPDTVRTVSAWVRTVVVNRVWGFQDTEDIVQAALLALVRNLRQGRFRPGNLRAYARRIAKNMCISHYRRVRARGSHVSLEANEYLSVDWRSGEAAEHRTLLDEVLERLDEGCRQILNFAYIQGYSGLEISRRLGVSEVAVRVRLYRCIRKVRALLEGAGGLGARTA